VQIPRLQNGTDAGCAIRAAMAEGSSQARFDGYLKLGGAGSSASRKSAT